MLDLLDQWINAYFAYVPREKLHPTQLERVKLVAHRGAHHFRKPLENTCAAFARARDFGCWGIEFDLHATADGVLVVNHDPHLQRLWQNNSYISQMKYKDLRKQVAEIPTLDEVISVFSQDLHFFIELKAPFTAFNALVTQLSPLTPVDQYHVISLDEQTLFALSKIPREACLLVGMPHTIEQYYRISLAKQYGGVLSHYLLLTKRKIKCLHDKNQQVGVGFVDSPNSLYREVKRNVDWLFSNQVEKIASLIGKAGLKGLAGDVSQ